MDYSLSNSNNETNHSAVYQSCPHFGVANDPSTGLLFPSQMGHCFRLQPSTAVSLEHQQTFCLRPNHTDCPTYCQTQPAPPAAPVEKVASRRLWLLPTALFLLLGLVGFVIWQQTTTTPVAPLPTTAQVAVVAETTVFTPTPTPTTQPAATATTPPPTATVVTLATTLPTATAPSTATSQPSPTETAVSVPDTAASETPTPELPSVVVNVERLNVRSGPSTEYPILLVAEAGTTFTAVGSVSARDWWQVCCVDGELAWVFAGSITFVGDETAVSPASNIPPVPTAEP